MTREKVRWWVAQGPDGRYYTVLGPQDNPPHIQGYTFFDTPPPGIQTRRGHLRQVVVGAASVILLLTGLDLASNLFPQRREPPLTINKGLEGLRYGNNTTLQFIDDSMWTDPTQEQFEDSLILTDPAKSLLSAKYGGEVERLDARLIYSQPNVQSQIRIGKRLHPSSLDLSTSLYKPDLVNLVFPKYKEKGINLFRPDDLTRPVETITTTGSYFP